MMRTQWTTWTTGLLFVVLTSLAGASTTDVIDLSPTGDDTNKGTEPAQALRTLSAAINAYEARCVDGPITIRLAPGDYGAERAAIKSIRCPLRIVSLNGVARFDGGGAGTWLAVATPGGQPADLTVKGLSIENFQSAISINGNRNDADQWISGVKVLGNRFRRIGSFGADQPPATAAIRLVNARQTLIKGNDFEEIRNVKHCDGMHAVYLAHHSTDNIVRDNTFSGGCGETIKVRDASNNNRIENNRFFDQTGSALLLDSFCDSVSGADCTKARPECPSWGNVFKNNVVDEARVVSRKRVTGARKLLNGVASTCPMPRALGAPRITEDAPAVR